VSILIDIIRFVFSHLPKLLSWWLYKPQRTTKNITFSVSAKDGSVEVWCDEQQSKFKIIIDIKNDNPFPIEIDRAEASASLYTARLKALNLFGVQVGKGESKALILESRMDEPNRKLVNSSPENERMKVELKAIIKNKHHHSIRIFNITLGGLMCRLINKEAKE